MGCSLLLLCCPVGFLTADLVGSRLVAIRLQVDGSQIVESQVEGSLMTDW
ncbi:hypothetical protein KC19_VG284100 [Ceratodon purpureus]|uniref:Uncharacterized protein n=1 Tax=Ceratodon purpureus TaxID=3225 RepID=A0A8T0HV35_CERPU|nr:hypothetical protein KC19_VG284100 [Ceratodon purpureus]